MIFEPDGQDTGRDCMRKAVILCMLPIQYSPDGKSALITEDNHTDQVKRLYQVNEPKGCMEETRWWNLQKETGQLEIWDALENQSIFEGPVSLDETGNLVNEKYYDRLLWEGLCQLWDYMEETTIRTWVDRYGFMIDDVGERNWEEDTVFSLKSVYGTDGADAVENFEETVEYTEAGTPDFYKSQGLMEHSILNDSADLYYCIGQRGSEMGNPENRYIEVEK